MPKVLIVMGSINDLKTVKEAVDVIKEFGVEAVARVLSAHRTPNEAHDLSVNAIKNGFEVIIGCAGKAAHLAEVLAASTTLPVIGLPILSSTLDGLDSLLSVVQMPQGIPVATVAINGAHNAGLLALQILGIKYPEIAKKLSDYKQKMAKKILEDDAKLQEMLSAGTVNA